MQNKQPVVFLILYCQDVILSSVFENLSLILIKMNIISHFYDFIFINKTD